MCFLQKRPRITILYARDDRQHIHMNPHKSNRQKTNTSAQNFLFIRKRRVHDQFTMRIWGHALHPTKLRTTKKDRRAHQNKTQTMEIELAFLMLFFGSFTHAATITICVEAGIDAPLAGAGVLCRDEDAGTDDNNMAGPITTNVTGCATLSYTQKNWDSIFFCPLPTAAPILIYTAK
jgi:hypothetical protein